MTIREKKEALHHYCAKTKCVGCKLNVGGWDVQFHEMTECLAIENALEKDLNRALKLIGYQVENTWDVENNPYWERITNIAIDQREKGLSEYGHGLEFDDADIMTRLDRIQEELIDALMYIEHLKDGIRKIKEVL